MAVTIYYEDDAPMDALKGRKVAVIGYGSQGHAHSQNLRDSGVDVAVAELEGTDNFKLAVEHGFSPTDAKGAMDGASLIIVALPDEVQATFESGTCVAVKLYPAGATTNSQDGVTDLRKTCAVLEYMQDAGMPLLVHGELLLYPSGDQVDHHLGIGGGLEDGGGKQVRHRQSY